MRRAAEAPEKECLAAATPGKGGADKAPQPGRAGAASAAGCEEGAGAAPAPPARQRKMPARRLAEEAEASIRSEHCGQAERML